MPRAGLTTATVVAAAADLSDEVGLDTLTLAALAEGLGVRLPSLYKHIDGLPALRGQLAVRAKQELTVLLAKATAGKSRRDALLSLADAYRGWASEHPGRYAASLAAPREGDADDQAASAATVEAVFVALSGYHLSEPAMVDAVRTFRAIIHGFLALERQGGFAMAQPVDDSLRWALETLDAAMTSAGSGELRG